MTGENEETAKTSENEKDLTGKLQEPSDYDNSTELKKYSDGLVRFFEED